MVGGVAVRVVELSAMVRVSVRDRVRLKLSVLGLELGVRVVSGVVAVELSVVARLGGLGSGGLGCRVRFRVRV